VSTDELWRQRVSDHQSYRFFAPGCRKAISWGKSLEEGRFTHRYGSVPARMQKPSFGWIETTAGYRRRNVIPCHPAINIPETITLLVTW